MYNFVVKNLGGEGLYKIYNALLLCFAVNCFGLMHVTFNFVILWEELLYVICGYFLVYLIIYWIYVRIGSYAYALPVWELSQPSQRLPNRPYPSFYFCFCLRDIFCLCDIFCKPGVNQTRSETYASTVNIVYCQYCRLHVVQDML